MHPPPDAVDAASLAVFLDAMFRYADEGTFVSLRAFYESQNKVFRIRAHTLAGDPGQLLPEIVAFATECARFSEPIVFCPPIATFSNDQAADEKSLANGLALSVECDTKPAAARKRLEALLGPATIVVASGGDCVDPDTGEVTDKLHLHWRLNETTRDAHGHRLLKRARTLATGLVGGDATNKPIVHPIRWPGSWHRKAAPRLARIVGVTESEIDLQGAIERLEDAASSEADETSSNSSSADSEVPPEGEERHTAELVRAILTGSDYHAPLVALAMRCLKALMPDAQVVLHLRGIMQAVPDAIRDVKDGAVHAGRWQTRYDDISRAVRTAREKLGAPPDTSPDDFADLTNPVDLQGIDPPAREWIVAGWLPVGSVTSLYGGAGFGKTLLAQQLQTATAFGLRFLGLRTMQCQSLAFYCEDDTDELHRRQLAICEHYGLEMDQLGAMRWQGRFGKQNVMTTVEDGLLKRTEFFEFVRKAAVHTGAKLLILDNIAQLFAGNENVRPEVTQFVNAIGAIAVEIGGAILLLGHPAKATDSQFSGSTAWDAAVRSRWILDRPKDEDGRATTKDPALADHRVLCKAKANYAGTGDEIALRWVRGAFKVDGAPSMDATNDAPLGNPMLADEAAFLEALAVLTRQGRNVSHSKHAGNFAPKVMVKLAEARGVPRVRLVSAMDRLFERGVIEVGTVRFGTDRKPVDGIVLKGQGLGENQDGHPSDTASKGDENDSGDGSGGCGTVQDEPGDDPLSH